MVVQEQRSTSMASIATTIKDSSPPDGVFLKDKVKSNLSHWVFRFNESFKRQSEYKFEPLGFQIQQIPLEIDCNSIKVNPSTIKSKFH